MNGKFLTDKIKIVQMNIKVLERANERTPNDPKIIKKLELEKQELEKFKDLYPSEFI